MMISKAKLKFIKSLQIKKYRKQEQCFIVEGAKSVRELLLSDFEVAVLIATPDFIQQLPPGASNAGELIEATLLELEGIGEFQTNDAALAIARMKPNQPFSISPTEFALVLDDIRDPGNLGTMLRTADWFGISKVIASHETSDFYNSKVISASMGSFTRVAVFYTDLVEFLCSTKMQVFGTFLEGEEIHKVDFGEGGLIVIGNESRGISAEVARFITRKITIPRYGHAESLNAAVATAIVLDNIRSR